MRSKYDPTLTAAREKYHRDRLPGTLCWAALISLQKRTCAYAQRLCRPLLFPWAAFLSSLSDRPISFPLSLFTYFSPFQQPFFIKPMLCCQNGGICWRRFPEKASRRREGRKAWQRRKNPPAEAAHANGFGGYLPLRAQALCAPWATATFTPWRQGRRSFSIPAKPRKRGMFPPP